MIIVKTIEYDKQGGDMGKYSLEITKFPERVRYRVGMDMMGTGKVTWIKPDKPGSKALLPELQNQFEKGNFLDICRDDDIVVQIILTEKGDETLSLLTKEVPVGKRRFVDMDNVSGEISDLYEDHDKAIYH